MDPIGTRRHPNAVCYPLCTDAQNEQSEAPHSAMEVAQWVPAIADALDALPVA